MVPAIWPVRHPWPEGDRRARRTIIANVEKSGFEIPRRKGHTNSGIALSTVADIIEAIALDTRHTLPVSVLVDGLLSV